MPIQRAKPIAADIPTINSSSLPTGSVLQVKQGFSGTKTITTTSASGNAIDCPASVSITPSSASNKILILFHGTWQFGNGNDVAFWLLRNGTAVGTATRSSENVAAFAMSHQHTTVDYNPNHISFNYLDTPSTTTAITYTIKGGGIQGTKPSSTWADITVGSGNTEEMIWGGSLSTSSGESNIGNMVIIAQEIKG